MKYANRDEAKKAHARQRKDRRKRLRAEGRCIDCQILIGMPPQSCRCPACNDRQRMRGKRGRRRMELADAGIKVPTFEDFERLGR
jgi:hypothetical protein